VPVISDYSLKLLFSMPELQSSLLSLLYSTLSDQFSNYVLATSTLIMVNLLTEKSKLSCTQWPLI